MSDHMIAVPRVPWHDDPEDEIALSASDVELLVDLDPDLTDEERETYKHAPTRRLAVRRGETIVEINGDPVRETR